MDRMESGFVGWWRGTWPLWMAANLVMAAAPVACGSSDEQAPTLADATAPPPWDAETDIEMPETEAGSDAGMKASAICSVDGWCWDLPTPQGNDLFAVWGSDLAHLFAVGELGTLLQFDGKAWTSVPWMTRDAFRGVWGASPHDVWAVGDEGVIGHFDGTRWTAEPLPDLSGTRLDGGRRPKLLGIAGTTKSNVWVVGEGGTILHFDGARWSSPASGTLATLRAVYCDEDIDAWAVGDGGVVLHFDGSVWTPDNKVGGTNSLLSVHGTGKNDVWAVGAQGTALHFDGIKWTRLVVDAATVLRSVVAERSDSVWAAGDNGSVWHWAGDSVTPADGGDAASDVTDATGDAATGDATTRRWLKIPNGTRSTFFGAWRLQSDDLFFVGMRGEILRWNAGSWERMGNGSTANRLAISVAAPGDVWIVGDETLRLGKDGWMATPAGTDRSLYGVSSVGASGAWAIGTAGTIMRLDGADAGTWRVAESPTARWLHSIWTAGSSAGWIVGGAGTALALLNGTVWQPISTGGTAIDLLDVWGSSVDDVWAVGDGGTILHWRNTGWALVSSGADSGMTSELRGVWGAGPKDVWAVGSGGTILHYDGLAWSSVASGEAYALNDVWGLAAANVWAVGTGGTILHWDGSSWKRQESGTDDSLNAVGGSADRVWAIGENGTILRYIAH